MENRTQTMRILQIEEELQEIVRLVGVDALSHDERLLLETAKSIREDFLMQNAFMDEDAYSSYRKQFRLLDCILNYDNLGREALAKGADMNKLFKIPVREKLGYAKMADPNTFEEEYDKINEDMKAQIAAVLEGGREDD
jgi:V/A-type H+-transporting ATPase subunit A